jgi:hypothetical protein
VTVADDTNTAAVAAVLNQYALRWHLNVPGHRQRARLRLNIPKDNP